MPENITDIRDLIDKIKALESASWNETRSFESQLKKEVPGLLKELRYTVICAIPIEQFYVQRRRSTVVGKTRLSQLY